MSRDEIQQTQYDERASLLESLRKYARDPYAHIWVAGLFLVFTVVMTWPLVLNMRDTLVSWGDPVFQAWTIAWNVHAWTTNPLDVFNANVLYPYRNTLAYSDHLFGQTIMVASIMLLTDNPILVDNISRFIALTLTGFFTYLLVYDITGNRLAGIVAGFAYAFIPNRMAHIEHLNILTAQWMPLALLAARRALIHRSTRWAVALGVVLFIQGISGVYFLYFTGILLGVVFVTYLLWDRTHQALLMVGKMIAICAIAALLLVPTLWPYQVVSQDFGIERTRKDVDLWSASRSDYFAVNPSNRLYGRVLAERHHRHLEQDLFPGVILVVLAIAGLFYWRLPWERWMLFTLALFSFFLSFGFVLTVLGREIPNPYQLFYEIVPGFRAIRVAARFGGQLMTLGLVGLAGLGVALITQQIRKFVTAARLQAPAVLGLGVLLITGMGLEYSTRMDLPGPLPTSLEEAERTDYAWMAENPAPAIELPMGEGDVASAWPNYWSTMHWNDVVNGYSAIAPPVYYVFRDRMDRFPDAGTVELLQGMGVETIVYHLEAGADPDEDPIVQAVDDLPELTEEIGPPDYVWTLDPDPWMWRLVAEVSDGEPVDLPAFQTDLPQFGMLAAILQRESHTIYGEGMLDYWDIPDAPEDVCYAIIPSDQNPGDWGYEGASQVHEGGPLILLRRADCEGS